jgi:hypothetical protein
MVDTAISLRGVNVENENVKRFEWPLVRKAQINALHLPPILD